MDFCTQDRALVFRITHHENVPWILENGLQCRNSELVDPNFVEIGRRELIDKRNSRSVEQAPFGTLSDYVPFYFNTRTPMLYNIKTGWDGLTKRPMNDIVMFALSLPKLASEQIPFVFTDRHAYLKTANFYGDLKDLDKLSWDLWQRNDFSRDYSKPEKMERYQAEALVYRSLRVSLLAGIVCYSDERAEEISALVSACDEDVKIYTKPGWYC